MKRRRGGGHGAGHGGSERWLITYADLITLLVAFFIMMYSLAQLDLAKFERAVGGYRHAAASLGVMPGGSGALDGGDGLLNGGPTPEDAGVGGDKGAGEAGMESSLSSLQASIQAMGLGGHVSVRLSDEGLVVSMAGPLLFESGQADIRAQARPILDTVARIIVQTPRSVIRVEGHADSVPIHTERYPSNWELSAARSAAVVRQLMVTQGVDGTRFIVVGYGDFRPVGSNRAAEGRARNRRVEIIILRPQMSP